MARNDIGNLNVRVTADTREFVNGMANVQRRTEQTAAVLQKSRQAFGALGSAMRMPGLGRGAALSGAASNILSTLGFGALRGGGIGAGIAAGFMVFDEVRKHYERMNALIEERRRKEQEITQNLLSQTKSVSQLAAQLESLGRGPAAASQQSRQAAAFEVFEQRRATLEAQLASLRSMQDALGGAGLNPGAAREVQSRNRVGLDSLRSQIAEVERLLAQAGTAYWNQTNGRINGMRPPRDVAAEMNEAAAAREYAREHLLGGRIRAGMAGAERMSISDMFGILGDMRADAAERAKEAKDLADTIERAVADWKRENQKASDLLATTVGRISSQITQLTYRSN